MNTCVWPRITRMEVDYNLKMLARRFQVLWLRPGKIVKLEIIIIVISVTRYHIY